MQSKDSPDINKTKQTVRVEVNVEDPNISPKFPV